MRNFLARLTFTLCFSTMALGQSPGVDGWVEKQINAILDAQNVNGNVGQNGKGSDRQKASPSADQRSTSLVDQSSATDFFSVAASVIPVTPGLSQFTSGATTSNSGAEGSTTATASLYAILAGLNKVSPTDPEFYRDHVSSRRFSFTIGTAASTQATDNTTTPATVYGAKVLLINDREIYKKNNLEKLKNVQKTNAAHASAKLKLQIRKMIFAAVHPTLVDSQGEPLVDSLGKPLPEVRTFAIEHLSTDAEFQATFDGLSADVKKRIQDLIESSIAPFAHERATLLSTYDDISKKPQLSFSYVADIRDSKGNNDHRVELILDCGLSPRINWTVNASGDYTDRKQATDSKGGRFATSFQGDLTKGDPTKPDSGWGKTPIRLTFSGEAKWQTAQKPQYTFQSELSIPLSPGVDLPIVYRYANRTAQINQTDSEARLGLSIDVSRLAQALK
jgi:hypothetical protein